MAGNANTNCIAFLGECRVAGGPLGQVATYIKEALSADEAAGVLVFDSADSRVIDLDLRGSSQEILQRLAPAEPEFPPATGKRGRGRPKLGVVAREVTLLPRHWEWLNGQPGGASVALRKLVEDARRANSGRDRRRAARESCYRFMQAMAGNRPHFEEASRALFAGERDLFAGEIAGWPVDIRDHCLRLAEAAFANDRSQP